MRQGLGKDISKLLMGRKMDGLEKSRVDMLLDEVTIYVNVLGPFIGGRIVSKLDG